MNQDDEKKLETPELEEEELDEVSGGTGPRELGETIAATGACGGGADK